MYFAVGAIILKLHFGNEGTNVIPNKDFWADLPNLVQVTKKSTHCPLKVLVRNFYISLQEGCLFSFRSLCPFLNRSKSKEDSEKTAYESKL